MINLNSYSISPIESAFNSGNYSQVLELIESYSQKNISLISRLELTYFKCRTYERLGKWELAWNLYYETEMNSKGTGNQDPNVKLILLVTKCYLLWRTGKLAEGIDEQTKNFDFINYIEQNHKNLENNEDFNFENWLGLFFIIMFNFYINTGELDSAWEMNVKSYQYYLSINYELYIGKILANFGEIHLVRGELNQALDQYEKSVELSRKNNDPITTIESLLNLGHINYLLEKNELALTYYEESMKIAQSLHNLLYLAKINYKMIIFYYNLGEKDEIQTILTMLEKLRKDSNQNRYIEQIVDIGTALNHLLSDSLKDTVIAQNILLKIYKGPVIDFDSYFFVMILLTEVTLLEFQIYTSKSILEELTALISDMLNLATKNNSTRLIIETRLLQAKIEIITGNLDRGEKLFVQAQFNAKEKQLNLLLSKINKEYDLFKQQITKWKNLIDSNASIAERLEFSEINSYIKELRTKVLK